MSADWHRVRVHAADSVVRRAVLWASGGRAVTLGNHIFLPDRCRDDEAVLAHELTHCAQYQAWGPWRYFTRGAAVQVRALLHRALGIGRNPYDYVIEPGKPFEAYGMEQQGQIIEDVVRSGSPPTAPTHSHRDPRSLP